VLRDVRIFNRSTLADFWTKHADAEVPLRLWFAIVQSAAWKGPQDVRASFGTADFLPGGRVVFDIKGNKYRLIAQIKYGPLFLVYIRFVGTHAEYDKIDATTI
jgi:mRNA interferase HigB